MASFNSITLDLSPLTDQIDQLRAELKTAQERLERAEKRLALLEQALDADETETGASAPNNAPSSLLARSGLGRGLDALIKN